MRKSNLLMRMAAVALGLVLSVTALLAQKNITVTGTVTDVQNEPLVGASVLQAGTTNGTMTDVDGKFTINVPQGAELEFSSIGFTTLKIKAEPKMKVSLPEDVEMLNETVVVGYGVQKRESLTSAISQIRSEDIAMTKSPDAVTALQGKIPGLMITQNTGKPGDFANSISIRGYGTPMVVVDGVVRSSTKITRGMFFNGMEAWGYSESDITYTNDLSVLNEINPDDIESISVLKDASATIYGLGAENGVILITTKKGQIKRPTVNVSAMLNLTQPVTPRDVESWPSFMKWENAMSDVSKMSHRFSDELIAAYESGDPNLVYTDWYDALYKKVALNQQYNVSLTGGTETVDYYIGGNFTNDNPIYKSSNFGYDRYSFNANVGVRLTKDLSARYTTSFRQSTNRMPGSFDVDWNLTYYLYATNPMVEPTTRNNPSHYSAVEEMMNPAALLDADASGYYRMDNKTFNNNLEFSYNAPFLKGLRFTASGAFDFERNKSSMLIKMYPLYNYETDELEGWFREETQYAENWSDRRRLYGRVQALYDNHFGKHNVSAMLGGELTDFLMSSIGAGRFYGTDKDNWLYTHDVIDRGLDTRISNKGTRSNTRTAGYIGRVNYNYDGKYLVELMGRYDGSYMYKKGKRWAFFPSYSLGWRISEEKFFKDILPFVNNLKLRWSDGFTGSNQGSPYDYITGYSQNGSWVFTEGKTTTGYANSKVESSILTWAKVRMMDFGVDWELWNGKFGGTFDWYSRKVIGTAATRTVDIPDFYSVDIPQENLNSYENQGLELTLYHRNTVGAFNYRIQGNVSFTRSRQTYIEAQSSVKYSSSMEYWRNYSLNRWSGYFGGSRYEWAGGQFTSIEDASSSQVLYDYSSNGAGNRAIVPGMYKIIDRNGNGYIDGGDVFYNWGNGSSPLQYGLLFSGSWKNLDFSVMFNGAALRYKSYMMAGYASFGKLNYLPSQYTDSYHVTNYGDDPWDPETEWTPGYWPALARVSQSGQSHNATYTASQPYNYINAAFLRLKSLEIGYRFSPLFLRKVGIKNARVFVNGGNLFTICNPLLKYIDPESADSSGSAGGFYQLNRSYNFGFNLTF